LLNKSIFALSGLFLLSAISCGSIKKESDKTNVALKNKSSVSTVVVKKKTVNVDKHPILAKVKTTPVQRRVTCYDQGSTTASGHRVQYGVCAASWYIYPPGTVIYTHNTNELLVVADRQANKHAKSIDRYVRRFREKDYPDYSKISVVAYGDRNWHNSYSAVSRGLSIRKELLNKMHDYRAKKALLNRAKGSSEK
jgi:hypothetical protein